HGRVCAEIATAQGWLVVGFVDRILDEQTINGLPVLGADIAAVVSDYPPSHCVVFVALGDNQTRLTVSKRVTDHGYGLAVLQHPSAIVSPSASIGAGTVLMPGVIVNANAKIGQSCILNTACSIDHDNELEDGVQLGPGVHAAGTVYFGRMAFVGTGAAIKPGVKIGATAIVGAGAAVIRDVAEGARVGGTPAHPI
ncbi:MAG: acetyltransferase, partial [Hyphomicrobiaceae bacterium]|nr:acetyltransferase [Hyphomicrobiaceae bacterium]